MAEVMANHCIQLFVERAAAVRPGFSLSPENAAAIAEICRKVDGLPLAVELAAARVRILSPNELLGRLDSRLAELRGGARDLPERQRTLRATIDWSHELLDPAEQRLFARLAVFAGGWTRDAAEAICAGDLASRCSTASSPWLTRASSTA
jgi:predicted ATPase